MWGVIAVGVIADTMSYPGSIVPGAPGPAFFPRLLAGLVLLCVAISLRRGRAPAAPRSEESVAPWRSVAAAAITIAAFLWLAPRTDAFLLLPPLVAALMWWMGERVWPVLLGVPILFTVFIYVILYRVLGVALPTRFF